MNLKVMAVRLCSKLSQRLQPEENQSQARATEDQNNAAGTEKCDDDDEEEEEEEEGDEEEDEEEDDQEDGDSLEGDDEDDDEEEEEPRLKYQRLGNSVSDILKRESASAVRLHDKFLALGTAEGWIYILDFDGNEIRRFGAHTAVVNDLR